MQALGMIETLGLISAIEALDAMTKSSNVQFVEKSHIGGGLVTVMVTGDVGAVKTAVEAGTAAVRHLNEESLISEHVIPRPDASLEEILKVKKTQECEASSVVEITEIDEISNDIKEQTTENISEVEEDKTAKVIEIVEKTEIDNTQDTEQDNVINTTNLEQENTVKPINTTHENQLDVITKADIDQMVEEHGFDVAVHTLNNMSVAKLRKLAREYSDFEIKGRVISKASKKTLITKFRSYYKAK